MKDNKAFQEYYYMEPYFEVDEFTMEELGTTLDRINPNTGMITMTFFTKDIELRGSSYTFRLKYNPVELEQYVEEFA